MSADISELKGKILKSVVNSGHTVTFETTDGETYQMFHIGECCEHVRVEDVVGDLADLIGHPILVAEERNSDDAPAPPGADSYTWTFYELATIKGSVTIRWLGESNGYYSESVDFQKVTL